MFRVGRPMHGYRHRAVTSFAASPAARHQQLMRNLARLQEIHDNRPPPVEQPPLILSDAEMSGEDGHPPPPYAASTSRQPSFNPHMVASTSARMEQMRRETDGRLRAMPSSAAKHAIATAPNAQNQRQSGYDEWDHKPVPRPLAKTTFYTLSGVLLDTLNAVAVRPREPNEIRRPIYIDAESVLKKAAKDNALEEWNMMWLVPVIEYFILRGHYVRVIMPVWLLNHKCTDDVVLDTLTEMNILERVYRKEKRAMRIDMGRLLRENADVPEQQIKKTITDYRHYNFRLSVQLRLIYYAREFEGCIVSTDNFLFLKPLDPNANPSAAAQSSSSGGETDTSTTKDFDPMEPSLSPSPQHIDGIDGQLQQPTFQQMVAKNENYRDKDVARALGRMNRPARADYNDKVKHGLLIPVFTHGAVSFAHDGPIGRAGNDLQTTLRSSCPDVQGEYEAMQRKYEVANTIESWTQAHLCLPHQLRVVVQMQQLVAIMSTEARSHLNSVLSPEAGTVVLQAASSIATEFYNKRGGLAVAHELETFKRQENDRLAARRALGQHRPPPHARTLPFASTRRHDFNPAAASRCAIGGLLGEAQGGGVYNWESSKIPSFQRPTAAQMNEGGNTSESLSLARRDPLLLSDSDGARMRAVLTESTKTSREEEEDRRRERMEVARAVEMSMQSEHRSDRPSMQSEHRSDRPPLDDEEAQMKWAMQESLDFHLTDETPVITTSTRPSAAVNRTSDYSSPSDFDLMQLTDNAPPRAPSPTTTANDNDEEYHMAVPQSLLLDLHSDTESSEGDSALVDIGETPRYDGALRIRDDLTNVDLQ